MWLIFWAMVFVLPNGEVKAGTIDQTKPAFETQEDCESYLLTNRHALAWKIAKELELPPGTHLEIEGVCKPGQPV